MVFVCSNPPWILKDTRYNKPRTISSPQTNLSGKGPNTGSQGTILGQSSLIQQSTPANTTSNVNSFLKTSTSSIDQQLTGGSIAATLAPTSHYSLSGRFKNEMGGYGTGTTSGVGMLSNNASLKGADECSVVSESGSELEKIMGSSQISEDKVRNTRSGSHRASLAFLGVGKVRLKRYTIAHYDIRCIFKLTPSH